MSDDFQPGEIVNITIRGVRVRSGPTKGALVLGMSILDETGAAFIMPPQAEIRRVLPAEWPPQVGDLWRDRNNELWFVVVNEVADGIPVVLFGSASGGATPDEVLRMAPLTLVHREPGGGAFDE